MSAHASPSTARNPRVLVISSTREDWFENQSCEFHFQKGPYSLGAIFYNLEKQGWDVAWAGWRTSSKLRKIARTIDDFQPDIIYTYGSTVALNPLICRKFLCKHKAFKVVHGWDDAYGDIWYDIAGFPGRWLMNFVEKLIVTKSDAVVTLSYYLQARGNDWGIDCHYIPNGADPIDRSKIKPGEIKLEGSLKLVYTGDQAKWKRTSEICEAMRHVSKDVKLYLTGRHYTYLDEYASDNCIFLGWVTKEEQFSIMSQADIFVCTSDQDCNAKIQEYLRWERPYLGYDGRANLFFCNGHNALLTHNYTGAITRLINEPELRTTLVQNAKSEIPIFTWSEIAEQFNAYFSTIIPQ